MASQRQVKILMQGASAWNKWRKENPNAEIELRGAYLWKSDLCDADLRDADLTEANLADSDLSRANLKRAALIRTNLTKVQLVEANLRGVNFSDANLKDANLNKANLRGANLYATDLKNANLAGADLASAYLRDVNLDGVNLSNANLSNTFIGNTFLGKIDFSATLGLEETRHVEPSTIGIDTIQLSKGKIPEKFLRGCGLRDIDIEFAKLSNPDLTNEEIVKIQYRVFELRATQALQISPLFISYSHADSAFVDHIDHALTAKGVRFWRDIHDAKAGRLETQIDLAIRQNPTVLLVLSKNSLSSDWVEHEVRHARKLEKELGRDALCPIALDDAWKSSHWPERVMEQIMEYNILDFSGWEDKSTFEAKFAKLLSGLDLFYKKPAT
jgi:uncharacterized protein YjbI with pentapeptide repeats